MAYGTKYRAQYIKSGHTFKVDIEGKDYAGGVTTIEKVMDKAVELKQRGASRGKTKSVVNGSELTFQFYSTNADAGQFDGIFNSDYKDYRVSYYRDSTLIWRGWLKPENFDREYVAGQYEISLSAGDGLADLKNITYNDFTTEEAYLDKVSAITIIKRCLEHTEIDLDIKAQINIIHNAGMTVSDCILTEATYDNKRFSTTENSRGKIDNCNKVLDKILTMYGVELKQIEGNWWIISKHEVDSFLYTYDWATLTPVRTSSDLELDITSYKFKGKGTKSTMHPIKAHEVTFNNKNLGLNKVPSLIDANWTNDDFAAVNFVDDYIQLITIKPNGTPPAADGGDILGVNSGLFDLDATGEDEVVITFSYRLPTLVPDESDSAPTMGVFLYYGTAGNEAPITAEDAGYIVLDKGGEWATSSRKFKITPATGGEQYYLRLFFAQQDGGDLWDSAIINVDNISSKIFFASGKGASYDRVYRTENTDTPSNEVTESVTVFGDTDNAQDAGELTVDGSTTYSWKRYGETETLPLVNLMGLQEVVDNSVYKDYLRVTVMDVDDNIKGYNKIKIGSKTHRINSFTKSHNTRRTNLELEEIVTAEPTNTLEEFTLDTQDGAGGSGSGSSTSTTPQWIPQIRDLVVASDSIWSSDKINTELEAIGVVAYTSNTGASDANKYQKIARYTIITRYHDFNGRYGIMQYGDASGEARSSELHFGLKQQDAFGSDPLVFAQGFYKDSFDATFGYVIVQNTPTTIVDLYIKVSTTYTQQRIIQMFRGGGGIVDVEYFSAQSFVTIPAGYVAGTMFKEVSEDANGAITASDFIIG